MEKGITKISVAGFKSIAEETELDIKPLTLLAGANSSGKSSFMQPLLLMKQTLEAPYDPGPLRLDGDNVKFTSFDQLLTSTKKKETKQEFSVVLEVRSPSKSHFVSDGNNSNQFHRPAFFFCRKAGQISVASLCPFLSLSDNAVHYERIDIDTPEKQLRQVGLMLPKAHSFKVIRQYCFLHIENKTTYNDHGFPGRFNLYDQEAISKSLKEVIHIPGLRGNPQRSYQNAGSIGPDFPGTFENYTACVIAHWGDNGSSKLEQLGEQLSTLGLTSIVSAKRLNDTAIEITVGRLPKNGRKKADMVNIADVGFGVSQTLPILVALLVAEPGQLVYLEQPEIHLHPRAQRALAGILVDAANRGVKVVAETHSSMLLLAVQTLVAKQGIDKDKVALHWFERDDKTGMSKVTTAKMSQEGTFGKWPVDFGEVELKAEKDYLVASMEARKRGK